MKNEVLPATVSFAILLSNEEEHAKCQSLILFFLL